MKDNQLVNLSKSFAISIINLNNSIKSRGTSNAIINQLLRSGTSIGANIHEAKYAQSRADFINKMEIALKESSETEYWLELIYRKQKLTEKQYRYLKTTCGTIRRKLIASITTAKGNVLSGV